MMTYKLIALSFIVTTPLFATAVVRLFGLNRFKITVPDVVLPLFAYQSILLSNLFFTHHFLPHYLLMLSAIAVVISLSLLIKTRVFCYRRFLKLFWRIGFLATVLFYLGTVASLFLLIS